MHFPHTHNDSYFTGDWKLFYYYCPEDPENLKVVLYNLEKELEEKNDPVLYFPEKAKNVRHMATQLEKEGTLYLVDKQGNELKLKCPF